MDINLYIKLLNGYTCYKEIAFKKVQILVPYRKFLFFYTEGTNRAHIFTRGSTKDI